MTLAQHVSLAKSNVVFCCFLLYSEWHAVPQDEGICAPRHKTRKYNALYCRGRQVSEDPHFFFLWCRVGALRERNVSSQAYYKNGAYFRLWALLTNHICDRFPLCTAEL